MRLAALTLAVAASVSLSACGDENQEVRAWMDAQRRVTPTVTERIQPPKSFPPFRYENAGQSDPFSLAKLSIKPGADLGAAGLRPDLTRRREALESFPLESIRMVGQMNNGRSNYALLQVDNVVYQARVGNFAGQNFGRIIKVTETEVALKELVQDAAGDWVERETSLHLQEGKPQEGKK